MPEVRPIDANALINKLDEMISNAILADTEIHYALIRELVAEQPTIEPEVRHGRWIPQGDDMWLCSNCKENVIFSIHESDRTEKQRYCCRCGARMDGGING